MIVALIVRALRATTLRKALRTGIAVSMGGEFGFALLTLLLQRHGGRPTELVQALLTAVALSMLVGPLLVRYNGRIADRILRPRVHAARPTSRSRRPRRAKSRSAST